MTDLTAVRVEGVNMPDLKETALKKAIASFNV